jgi:hypothetical protein
MPRPPPPCPTTLTSRYVTGPCTPDAAQARYASKEAVGTTKASWDQDDRITISEML